MSRPLHELADQAPPLSPIFRDYEVAFPMSNDDLEGSFEQALSRTSTPEYAAAHNRVAVLVGESALTNNIIYMPEETIVLLDNRMGMCQYMNDYVRLFREQPNAPGWFSALLDPERTNDWLSTKALDGLEKQILQSQFVTGRTHALGIDGDDRYRAAREAARSKAIIPWHADITSNKDMSVLGGVLRANDAKVTLLNLSNVIPFTAIAGEGFSDSAQYAEVLDNLPTTSKVPILTTSRKARGFLGAPTGPFFGLDDLANNGGDSLTGPVATPKDNGWPDGMPIGGIVIVG